MSHTKRLLLLAVLALVLVSGHAEEEKEEDPKDSAKVAVRDGSEFLLPFLLFANSGAGPSVVSPSLCMLGVMVAGAVLQEMKWLTNKI